MTKLGERIDALMLGISLKQLSRERERLTAFYLDRCGERPALNSSMQRLAYLSSRMLATYEVICKVLGELKKRAPGVSFPSVLDVGSGPGTVLFAFEEMHLGVQRMTLLERDPQFILLAKQLCEGWGSIQKTWLCQDVMRSWSAPVHDVVIASYVLNELKESDRLTVLKKLWQLAGQFLIVIEPGTPADFFSLKQIREQLVQEGGFLVAPCPHTRPCPLSAPDWCHFAARLERSSLQRKVKSASLNYEDEKFSYLICSKTAVSPCQLRVLKRPQKGGGFIKIQFCSSEGIEEKVATKKNKEFYSNFKKLEWGDGADR